ncbi:Uncharacterized protein GBIM_04335 [Gryllus bimaculatus]|nr:Uncharacterized protein GBIM_04335 [Gryllus bimaculatus]
MASNNRKAPPRWLPKNADDRNRHAASRAPQMGGSLHAKRRIDNKKIQETLDEMFYKVFDAEIILNKSIETLMMLSEDCETPNAKLADNFGTNSSYKCQLGPNYVSKEKSSISKSRWAKDSCKYDENSEREACGESPFTCTTKKSMQPSKGKSVMMNASQGSIKVKYKGQDDSDISDDDADVVIEEENEFVMSELDLPFVDESTRSMYQFLTPYVPLEQSLCSNGMQYSRVCASRQNSPCVPSNKCSVKPGQSPSKLSNNICDKSSEKSPGKKAKHWPKLERIRRLINEGIKVMVLMRGCPGSGKTSLARKIIKSTHGQDEQKYIFSTDHYFIFVGNGKYKFDPRLLPNAHKWNQDRVNEEVRKETNPIIIDNTNLEAWEMEPYVTAAVKYGYSVEFLEPRTSWRNNAFELEHKNTHGVARKKIEDMLSRFERELTPTKLFALYNLKYSSNNLPPQYVSQQKHLTKDDEDSIKHGTKKKLKSKRKEIEYIESVVQNRLQVCKNEVARQLKVSETLSSDFTDDDIKDSISLLVSEFNRSMEMATHQEIDFSLENVHQEDGLKMAHGVSDENNCDDLVRNISENLLKKERSDEITEKDFNIFAGLDSEIIGDDEGDFVSGCSESSGEVNCPDDWEGECEDMDFKCSGGTLSDPIDKTAHLKKRDVEDITGLEYVLVMTDGTLLPQRSYCKEKGNSSLKGKGREWEYLLMTDDDSKLMFLPIENNTSQNMDSKKSAEVIPDSFKVDAPILASSADLPEQVMEDSKTSKNTFLQKIAAEEPSLEYLLFRNENMEDILGSDNVIGNSKDEDSNLVSSVNSNYKGLDLLLAEGAASLNIVFAGVDDALSPGGSPVIHNPDVRSISKEHCPGIKKSGNDSLQIDSKETKIVSIKENKYNETFLPQNKVLSNSNELLNFMDIHPHDNKIKKVKEEKFIDIAANSYVSEFESQIETFVETSVSSDVTEKNNEDLFFMNSFCETKLNNERSALEGTVANSCSLEDNNKSVREEDILEEWAEGTGWDEQESSNAKKVILHPDTSPKPARNIRRHISVESSPQKISWKENKDKIHETVAADSWFAVDEPVATWSLESQSLDKNIEKSSQVIEPQPQRELFALAWEDVNKVKKEKMTGKELRKSSYGSCKEYTGRTEETCLKSVANGDHVKVTDNVEFADQIIATDTAAENLKEQIIARDTVTENLEEQVIATDTVTENLKEQIIGTDTVTENLEEQLLQHSHDQKIRRTN